jgi:hypothetical protein
VDLELRDRQKGDTSLCKLRQGKEGCLEWVAQLMKVFPWLLKQFFEAQNGTYQAKDHTKSDELPIHDKIPTKFMHKF